MTPEEIARFALMLSEADKVRARIAEDEQAEGCSEPHPGEDYVEAVA